MENFVVRILLQFGVENVFALLFRFNIIELGRTVVRQI